MAQRSPNSAPREDVLASRGATNIEYTPSFDRCPARWPQEAAQGPQKDRNRSPRGPQDGSKKAQKAFKMVPKFAPSGSPKSLTSPLVACLLHYMLTCAAPPDSFHEHLSRRAGGDTPSITNKLAIPPTSKMVGRTPEKTQDNPPGPWEHGQVPIRSKVEPRWLVKVSPPFFLARLPGRPFRP